MQIVDAWQHYLEYLATLFHSYRNLVQARYKVSKSIDNYFQNNILGKRPLFISSVDHPQKYILVNPPWSVGRKTHPPLLVCSTVLHHPDHLDWLPSKSLPITKFPTATTLPFLFLFASTPPSIRLHRCSLWLRYLASQKLR